MSKKKVHVLPTLFRIQKSLPTQHKPLTVNLVKSKASYIFGI